MRTSSLHDDARCQPAGVLPPQIVKYTEELKALRSEQEQLLQLYEAAQQMDDAQNKKAMMHQAERRDDEMHKHENMVQNRLLRDIQNAESAHS